MTDSRVSIIICTHNRAGILDRCLASVAALTGIHDPDVEVLLVDNASSDDTRSVARRHEPGFPLRYVLEPNLGKTFALNRGLKEARGSLLLFTDDDVELEPDWLEAYRCAASRHPAAGWFGGRVTPWWETGRPRWLRDECLPALRGCFVLYDLGDQERPYKTGDLEPVGANMAVRRSTFEAIGGYREDLGPRGGMQGTNDDTELIERAQAAEIPGVYVPAAACRHLVPAARLRLPWFLRYGLGKGANQARALGARCPRGSLWRAANQAVRGVPQWLRGRGDRARICCVNVGIELGRRRVQRGQAAS